MAVAGVGNGLPFRGTQRLLVSLEDLLARGSFLAVPLACTPLLWDQFTTAKWYAFELAAILSAVLFAGRGSGATPLFLRRHSIVVALLVLWTSASLVRTGIARAVSPTLACLAFVVITVLFHERLRRHRGDARFVAIPAAISVATTDAFGLAQNLGHQPLPWLTAGDLRSSFFGNVNLAAEFLAFGLAFVLWLRARTARVLPVFLLEALAAVTLAHVFILRGRSALLAAALVLIVWVNSRGLGWRAIARIVTVAAALAFVLTPTAAGQASLPDTGGPIVETKALRTSIRLGLWKGTLAMIRDHPLGVGAGNFVDRFVPYQLVGLVPDERLLYRSPHDDYLRVIAEEGWPGTALVVVVFLLLAREVRRGWSRVAPADRYLGLSLFLALAVDAAFQFPLEVAPAMLVAGWTLAWALWMSDLATESAVAPSTNPPDPRGQGRPSLARIAWAVTALLAASGLVRVVLSERLFVEGRSDRAMLERSCTLDPRRVEACVLAAWQEMQSGEDRRARAVLAGLLEHSPYYYPAVKLLGQHALTRGAIEEGCFDLWLYDRLFGGASSVHATIAGHCPPTMVASFPVRADTPRYGRFPTFVP